MNSNELIESTPPRQQLAQAVEAKAQAEARLAQQRAAQQRAAALVDASLSEVRELVNLLQRQADEEALAVAEQLRSGESTTTLGAAPTVVSIQRQGAEQRLAVAQRASEQLAREARELEKAVAEKASAVHACACAVLRSEADGLAEEIDRKERALFALRLKLRGIDLAAWGLSTSSSSGAGVEWNRPALLSPHAHQAMQRPEEPQFVGGQDPAKDEARRWVAFHAALCRDAAATTTE